MLPENIHFIGIGGAGMSGLALIMHQKGFSVSGSDMSGSLNTDLLKAEGIPVVIGHSPENIPPKSPLLIVRSSAVSEENPEYHAAAAAGHKCVRRGEMLATLAATYRKTVAVAGSHGKTSVTALLVHVLSGAGLNPGFMIGGKVCGMKFSAAAGDGSLFITESDESDGTQVHLKSNILLITNIEDDHCWTLGGRDVLFANFATAARNAGLVMYNSSDTADTLLKFHPDKIPLSFKNDIFNEITEWGDFQKENANLALRCAVALGVDWEKAVCEIRRFPGVERRMSLRLHQKDFAIIEDYAHHPTEVRAAIAALRQRFPGYRLKIIFQPHRYARLQRYVDEFACELRKADDIIIVPVFSAWTEIGPVSSENLAEKIGSKAVFHKCSWQELAALTVKNIRKPEVLAILGAGDVEKLIPELKKLL
jgi:UDP-N-acetylmuramate--alanine ligase